MASIHVKNFTWLLGDLVDFHSITDGEIEGLLVKSEDVTSLSLRPIYKIPERVRLLKEKIAKISPDVIHVHQANSCALYAILASNKIPVVVTAWGSDILLGQNQWLTRKLINYILKKGSGFTASCEYLLTCMRRINPMQGKPQLNANFGIETKFPEYPKEKLIYSNRHLNQLYRVDSIIKDFSIFAASNKGDSWKLVIAGTGSEEQELKKLTFELGLNESVLFTGWLTADQNRIWYSKSTIFISLPESDSTSLSLYEAMAAKCIPVVSDLPANREVIKDGINGILVKENDSAFILKALELKDNSFLENNKKIAIENAGKEQNRARFLSFYKIVLGSLIEERSSNKRPDL